MGGVAFQFDHDDASAASLTHTLSLTLNGS